MQELISAHQNQSRKMNVKIARLKFAEMQAIHEQKEQEFLDGLTQETRDSIGVARKVSELEVFHIDGKKYTVTTKLTMSRLKMMERFRIKLGTGYDIAEMRMQYMKQKEHMNKGNFVDAAVILNNLIVANGEVIEQRTHPMYNLACIFLIREDEKLREFDQVIHDEKVKALESSDILRDDVFQWVSKLVIKSTAD